MALRTWQIERDGVVVAQPSTRKKAKAKAKKLRRSAFRDGWPIPVTVVETLWVEEQIQERPRRVKVHVRVGERVYG